MNVVEGSRCKMMQILRQVNVYMSIYYCICLFNSLRQDSVFMSVAYLFDLNKGTLLFFLQNKHTHTQAEVSLYLDIECHCRKISVTSLSHADEPFFFSSDLLQWFMHLSESLHTSMAGGKKSSSYQTGALQYSYSPLSPFIDKIINHQVWNVLKL